LPRKAHDLPTARQLPVGDDYLHQVPRLLLAPAELHAAELDHREYFIISLLDGATTVDMLLDLCGLPSEEALALIDALVRRGILAIG
jgi:hypothetical protein